MVKVWTHLNTSKNATNKKIIISRWVQKSCNCYIIQYHLEPFPTRPSNSMSPLNPDSLFQYLIHCSNIWFTVPIFDSLFQYLIHSSNICFTVPIIGSLFQYLFHCSNIWFTVPIFDSLFQYLIHRSITLYVELT